MHRFGFLRLSCVSPVVHVADPQRNVDEMLRVIADCSESDIVLFPELSITGYSCGDLFQQLTLLTAAAEHTMRLAEETAQHRALIVVGLPISDGRTLFNCAAVIYGGEILGIVPKTHLPTYAEYYEQRWFTSGNQVVGESITLLGEDYICDPSQLFEIEFSGHSAVVGVEICEDLWVPSPPSERLALAGANVLLNLSASTQHIGKHEYRRDLVVGQSGRCVAAYALASAGPSESTTDVVFSGHSIIAENGQLLAEHNLFAEIQPKSLTNSVVTTADIDIERLTGQRHRLGTFVDAGKPANTKVIISRLEESPTETHSKLNRHVPAHPFVPSNPLVLKERCHEIFMIQCHGLAKRLTRLGDHWSAHIGVSGGLDSTLALLVAAKTCDLLGVERSRIHGITMPGFGTTDHTYGNAIALMEHLQVSSETIDIRQLCLESFRELNHEPFGISTEGVSVDDFQTALRSLPEDNRHDLIFENVQARLRTFLLMSRGFVIGTGDLSEMALGWSTYNGDQMSMYNPNCSIPKTLVRFLVRSIAEQEFEGKVRETLLSISETPISPELLPTDADGNIAQETESTIGPYELHDFFLYHVIRDGFGPAKILFLAEHAQFERDYSKEEIKRTLRAFYERFFANQFKRSCVPDGPKVGSVTLSPRGDWRMPSDAEATAWLAELDGEN
ncbi:NAD(+) synthase [Calycomorphotria hydatis]|uniref:Glutamine-dependent NAD(+) synthetase n=1 Tax=Calycomorphotria hydatis TaxID=2528027 RepID=A0A517TB30_9PLAN|nr:NAD(+) synthase [Calycomorphotria hydatis]QDT65583.1 Glutamine-dependent NAD(+) synthetase [Calycomorphotria hydatis]